MRITQTKFTSLDNDTFHLAGDKKTLEVTFPEEGLDTWPFRRLDRDQALSLARVLLHWAASGELRNAATLRDCDGCGKPVAIGKHDEYTCIEGELYYHNKCYDEGCDAPRVD